jgi:hypothetical protein
MSPPKGDALPLGYTPSKGKNAKRGNWESGARAPLPAPYAKKSPIDKKNWAKNISKIRREVNEESFQSPKTVNFR